MNVKQLEKERDMYKRMYFLLGANVCDVIETCTDPVAKQKLIDAHLETEDIFISEYD